MHQQYVLVLLAVSLFHLRVKEPSLAPLILHIA